MIKTWQEDITILSEGKPWITSVHLGHPPHLFSVHIKFHRYKINLVKIRNSKDDKIYHVGRLMPWINVSSPLYQQVSNVFFLNQGYSYCRRFLGTTIQPRSKKALHLRAWGANAFQESWGTRSVMRYLCFNVALIISLACKCAQHPLGPDHQGECMSWSTFWRVW
jgi:hypothetical protein